MDKYLRFSGATWLTVPTYDNIVKRTVIGSWLIITFIEMSSAYNGIFLRRPYSAWAFWRSSLDGYHPRLHPVFITPWIHGLLDFHKEERNIPLA